MRSAAAMAIGGLLSCSLVTDLDGFAPSSSATDPREGAGADASTPTGVEGGSPDGGQADASCNLPTDSDPKNCGQCGRDCRGGTCTAGACGPGVIAAGFDHPLGVGLSQGKLYVGDQQGLHEVALDGAKRQVVDAIDVAYVWATDTDVFFSENRRAIFQWAPSSGGEAKLVTSVPDVLGIALSPTHLYYARYTEVAQGGGVYRQPLVAPAAPEKLEEWRRAECVAWADGKLYFAGDGENEAHFLRDDGTTDRLLEGGGPTGIFVLGDDAFITRQSGGEIVRVSLSTKVAEVLVRGLKGPSGIVATPAAVFWVELDDGKLGVLVR